MFDALNHVDWDLLHEQKLTLLRLLEREPYDSPDAEALSGLINLLDTLQDEATDIGIWAFPDETEDVPATQPPSKRYYVEDDYGHYHGPLDNYEEAAAAADAIHGRIIVQDVNPPFVAQCKTVGKGVRDGQA
jgi:hypothetical protein